MDQAPVGVRCLTTGEHQVDVVEFSDARGQRRRDSEMSRRDIRIGDLLDGDDDVHRRKRYQRRSATISAISRTAKRSSTFSALTPSSNMVTQNGQATATPLASVATASLRRLWLIRVPLFSSMNARAPPAPQQKPRSRHRGSST